MLLVNIYDFFTNTAIELRRLYLLDDISGTGTPKKAAKLSNYR